MSGLANRNDWLRPLGFFVVFGFLAAVLYAVLPRLLGTAAGPEAEIVSYIKAAEREGLRLPAADGGAELKGSLLHFDRITVTAGADPRRAEAIATLDFIGTFGGTKVSSLGYEKIPFRYVDGAWEAEGALAPRLWAIVQALEARRAALEHADAAALSALSGRAEETAPEELLRLKDRRYEARAWYIRSERDEVQATEEARLSGALPERPVDDAKTTRLVLAPRGDGGNSGREFFFPAGLM